MCESVLRKGLSPLVYILHSSSEVVIKVCVCVCVCVYGRVYVYFHHYVCEERRLPTNFHSNRLVLNKLNKREPYETIFVCASLCCRTAKIRGGEIFNKSYSFKHFSPMTQVSILTPGQPSIFKVTLCISFDLRIRCKW